MSYVLGMSFEYHRYHRDAIIKVYADDQLVDEFSLTKDIKLKTVDISRLPPASDKIGPQNFTRIEIFPEKLFLFEISEQFLHDRIRIEVENSYNNHTNGFMTEYAYIKFRHLFVVPKCLLQYKTWTELPLFDLEQDIVSQEIARKAWEVKHGFFVFSLERDMLENVIVKSGSDALMGGLSKYDKEGIFRRGYARHRHIEVPVADTQKDGFLNYCKGGNFTVEIPLSRTHNIAAPVDDFITPKLLWAFNVLNMSI